MAVKSEQVGHSALVGGEQTALHSHAGGGGGGNCNMKIVTYAGNGQDNRNIDIGVNLASKTFKYVILKQYDGAEYAYHRAEYGQGDLSHLFVNSIGYANSIQQFTSTGFEVGSDNSVNRSGYNYFAVVFWVD